MSFTKLYLTNRTAPFTPTNVRGTWTDTVNLVTRALDPSKSDGGSRAVVGRTDSVTTNPFDALLYRGVSGPLDAQTISGTIDVCLGVNETNASADMCYKIHVYVTVGDSDTVRGTLLSNYAETTANEWSVDAGGTGAGTSLAGRQLASAQTLSSLAISAGDRIVVEIGYHALNSVSTSFTGWLNYGTVSGTDLRVFDDITTGTTNQSTHAGYITFSSSISEEAELRETQFLAEEPNRGSDEIVETQFLAEEPNKGSGEIVETQFLGEFPNESSHELHITQFVLESVSPSGADDNFFTFITA